MFEFEVGFGEIAVFGELVVFDVVSPTKFIAQAN